MDFTPMYIHVFAELIDFLALLDKRYEDKVKKDGTFMARKVRQSELRDHL